MDRFLSSGEKNDSNGLSEHHSLITLFPWRYEMSISRVRRTIYLQIAIFTFVQSHVGQVKILERASENILRAGKKNIIASVMWGLSRHVWSN